MRVYQMLNTLIHGDAIGNAAFALRGILRKYDSRTQILAVNIGSAIHEDFVKKLSDLSFVRPDDVVIYHMCERSIINALLKNLNCRKIAIYHNTTPAYFFKGIDLNMYSRQIQSAKEISGMRDVFDLCVAVSQFNKNDLLKMGYAENKIEVLPLIIPTYEYTVGAEQIQPYFNDGLVNILFVGRIVPNKKQEDIIRIFAYYQKFINKESRLILVGSPFSEKYLSALKAYVQDIGVSDVVFISGLSFSDIKRIYKSADLFLCMSEHEGFCVPIVEAMLFNVPVIAYESSAVPDTLGNGGCLIDTKNPHKVANYINKILTDRILREMILNWQAEKVKCYDYNATVQMWDHTLACRVF